MTAASAAIRAKTATGSTVHTVQSDIGDTVTTLCGREYWREMPRHEHDYPGFAEGHVMVTAEPTCRRCAQIMRAD